MKFIIHLITFAAVLGLQASRAQAAATESSRELFSLDQGWRFHLGDIPMPVLKTHDETYQSAKAGKPVMIPDQPPPPPAQRNPEATWQWLVAWMGLENSHSAK